MKSIGEGSHIHSVSAVKITTFTLYTYIFMKREVKKCTKPFKPHLMYWHTPSQLISLCCNTGFCNFTMDNICLSFVNGFRSCAANNSTDTFLQVWCTMSDIWCRIPWVRGFVQVNVLLAQIRLDLTPHTPGFLFQCKCYFTVQCCFIYALRSCDYWRSHPLVARLPTVGIYSM